jgi:hypothetical protein
LDARQDFGKRRIAAGRGVVAKWCEAAIISRSQLLDGNVTCSQQYPITDFLGRFDARIDRCDDADEHALMRSQSIPNQAKHVVRVVFAREGNVEVAHVQRKKIRKQIRIIHLRAMC